MKVHLFYLSSDTSSIYAYTTNEKYVEKFLYERCKKAFIHRIEKMDKPIFQIFSYKNKLKRLIEIPLESDNGYTSIIGTEDEDRILGDSCESISDSIITIKNYFEDNVPLKSKYDEVMSQICTTFKDVDNHPYLQIDTLKLFYYLFRNTFLSEEISEMIFDDLRNKSYKYNIRK